ncbi:alpha/beta-hydrolase [Basidiobolus meristosporus CBS 931.73]|uniref:Alpha/beta-hydrolase n=1 Tax=Basidiobolus meristosporus CBS 931.73 TaxID=1314790 RepID=A0A1Y1WXA9_9FUNG|nr:alpha/beta-hydrolase [Basidiobolus meristosporus CBS 931.73]|eukprot:ORX78025.1 alpha/beta-hydrolase [Basidiobolus meristosporus CBS 931.73]
MFPLSTTMEASYECFAPTRIVMCYTKIHPSKISQMIYYENMLTFSTNVRCEDCTSPQHFWANQYLHNPNRDSAGYIGLDEQEKKTMLSFRGTVNFKNLLNDANAVSEYYTFPETSMKVNVHKGFHQAYLSFQAQVRQSFKNLLTTRIKDPKLYTLAVVGHSLGGSIAAFAALDVFSFGSSNTGLVPSTFGLPHKNVYLHTYGQLATGDKAFAQQLYNIFEKKATIANVARVTNS